MYDVIAGVKKTKTRYFASAYLKIHLQRGNMDHYTYGGWWSVWWTGTYSMVLSKAAFFHKKYLAMYTNEFPASLREYIAHNRYALELLDGSWAKIYYASCNA